MTLKQVFKRYLKNTGLYGELFNFYFYRFSRNYAKCQKYLDKCNANDLFLSVCTMERMKYGGRNWYYTNKPLYSFVNDWCKNKINIKPGDTITCKTLDGKYEFNYKVVEFWYSRLEVEVENYQYINIERISKINGKDCDFSNSWELKRI